MTVFENTLLILIHEKCRDKKWWNFNSVSDLHRYWDENCFRIDQACRYFAISVNERELNVFGFDALSEGHNIDMDSVLISRTLIEEKYEKLYFG